MHRNCLIKSILSLWVRHMGNAACFLDPLLLAKLLPFQTETGHTTMRPCGSMMIFFGSSNRYLQAQRLFVTFWQASLKRLRLLSCSCEWLQRTFHFLDGQAALEMLLLAVKLPKHYSEFVCNRGSFGSASRLHRKRVRHRRSSFSPAAFHRTQSIGNSHVASLC